MAYLIGSEPMKETRIHPDHKAMRLRRPVPGALRQLLVVAELVALAFLLTAGRLPAREPRLDRIEHISEEDGLSHSSVRVVHQDSQGFLWIATEGYLHRDRSGDLWIATDAGLDRWNGSGGFHHYLHDSDDSGANSGANVVLALYEDSRGVLWISTGDGGLNRLDDRDRGLFTRFGPDPVDATAAVYHMLEDRAGRLWLGTWGDGLILFDRPTGTWTHYRHDPDDRLRLISDYVQDLFEDRTGTLWVATQGGLEKIDLRRERFEVLRHRPGKDDGLVGRGVMSCAQEAGGKLWLGFHNGGVSAYDRERGTFRNYGGAESGVPAWRVEAVLEDRFGVLWVGAGQGLAHFDRARDRFVAEPSFAGIYVLSLLERGKGDLWVGTTSSLFRRTPDGQINQFSHDPDNPGRSSSDIVYSLHEDRSGRLWLATMDGLSRFDEASGSFVRFDHDPDDTNNLSHEFVTIVYEDASGIFWIGTYGGGLNRFDPAAGRWRSFREEDGLANDKVVALVDAGVDSLWIATQKGLSRFDPRQEAFRNYDVDDGLAGNIFFIGSQYAAPDGEIFFGGPEGLTSFDPRKIRDDPEAPEVVLTELRISDEPVTPAHGDRASPLERSVTLTRELTLDHRHKTFSLSFAALHFASPHKNGYAYRLEGYDEDWIETGAERRFARYTNLDPGRYTFRVKASNPDGAWNEDGASVRIRVLPPPWKTWWAYSFYVLALAVAVLAYVRSHREQLRREREAAEREPSISRRLREIDKLKDEFLANTSHELRTPLYGITGLAESLVDGARGPLPEPVRADLSMVAASGRRLGHRPLVGSKALGLVNAVPADLPAADADENRRRIVAG